MMPTDSLSRLPDNKQPLLPAWLFVRVIDHYGDIGVVWRLGMQMARELGAEVHIWVDNRAALAQLVPQSDYQHLRQQWPITAHVWADDAVLAAEIAALPPPRWVIETFACTLPPPVLAMLPVCRPLWLNWEYLSAEDWAESCHGLPSLQGNGVPKYFWLMGFGERSGGLLREADYLTRRQAFMHDKTAQQAFRQRYGLPEKHHGQLWLIFAYASTRWPDWLSMWQASGEPMTLWLADHHVVDSWQQAGCLPKHALQQAGDVYESGRLTLVRLPFVPQSEFDCLLWLADAAVVRGEDSFVRTQWAGIPFFWHIYPQQQHAHWAKLHAFWNKVTTSWPAALQTDFAALSDDLNGVAGLTDAARHQAWHNLCIHQLQWQTEMHAWQQYLLNQPSAMEKLARFSQDTLE